MKTDDKNLILLAKNGDTGASETLFLKYSKFIEYCYGIMCVDKNDHDDFKQLTYIALVEAIRGFDLSRQTSFIAYWKYYILSEYYQFKLQMHYCTSISRGTYTSLKSFSDINQIILDRLYTQNVYQIDDKCINDIMYESIWGIVDSVLTDKNSYILKQIYVKERTLTSIAKELEIGVERVRQRKIRSLEKLHENLVLRGIYYSYFN